MKLKSIYSINSIKSDKNEITVSISFNKEHEVFTGHFPGNPVVPGVVQVQILKDLMESELKTKTIKYLNVIIPGKQKVVEFEISYKQISEKDYSVKCIVKSETMTFMKFSGSFINTD